MILRFWRLNEKTIHSPTSRAKGGERLTAQFRQMVTDASVGRVGLPVIVKQRNKDICTNDYSLSRG